MLANGVAGYDQLGASVEVNGTFQYYWGREDGNVGTSGTDAARAVVFSITLSEGDAIKVNYANYSSSAATIKAQYNAPRIVIIWRGPAV